MKINQDNLDKLKELAGKIEYTVKDTKKIARISAINDGTAYDLYKEHTQELYEEVKGDIVCIFNANTRDYFNIITVTGAQVVNDLDLSRLNLLEWQQAEFLGTYVDIDRDGKPYFMDYNGEYLNEKQEETLLRGMVVEHITARGYSQGDYEKYVVVYYKDTKEDNLKTIKTMLDNLKCIFTVQEYHVEKVTKETRVYTSGIEEVEEVEEDNYCHTSYTGDTKELEEELTAEGYNVEIKY